MLMVVFQLRLSEDRGHAYLELAAWLRPELLEIEGFLGNERWRSPIDPTSLLALSSWRDEAAVLRWRKHAGHQLAQARGRGGVFTDYRLRVGETVDEGRADLAVVIGAGDARPAGGYDSIAEDGRWCCVADPGAVIEGAHQRLRVLRDYGMHHRKEAPAPVAPDDRRPRTS